MGTTLCRPSSLTVLPLPIITRICPSPNRNLPFIFDRHAAMYLHGTFVGVFIVQSTCCVRMRHIHTQGILSITHTETVAWSVAGLTHEYTTCNCTPQSTAMLLQLSHLMLVAGCKLTRTLATAKWHFTARLVPRQLPSGILQRQIFRHTSFTVYLIQQLQRTVGQICVAWLIPLLLSASAL